MIRGELILPKTARATLDTDKNLRSIVSGVVNAKHPKLEVLQLVHFVAYSLPEAPLDKITPLDQMELLALWGFRVPKYIKLSPITVPSDGRL